MGKEKTRFEFKEYAGFTAVALDSRLSDYNPTPIEENGQMVLKTVERTIKDCRHIDGCVYFHLGHVDDSVMVRLIELFQKLKQDKSVVWEQNIDPIIHDPEFKF